MTDRLRTIAASWIAGLCLFLLAPALQAAPVVWALQFDATPRFLVSGVFTYDAATNAFSDITLVGTDLEGAGFLDTTYRFVDPAETNTAQRVRFWDSVAADRSGAKYIDLVLGAGQSLTDAGGAVVLSGVFPAICSLPTCVAGVSLGLPNVVTGTLQGDPVGVVSEPQSGALLVAALAALGSASRRRRRPAI